MARINENAFPVHPDTFQGIATDEPARAKGILHSDADGAVTITFGASTPLSLTVALGEDLDITGADTVTSTASIKLS